MALACHHRVVVDSPKVKLGLPESTLGLLPGAGGTQRLPRMIGVQPSMPLLLEGKQLRPGKAKALGIVDEVVAAEALVASAKAWLATGPSAVQPWDVKGFQVPGGGARRPRHRQRLLVANAMLMAKTYGNYPAGRAILSCLFEGLRMPLDRGLEVEKRYSSRCSSTPWPAHDPHAVLQHGRSQQAGPPSPGSLQAASAKVGVLGAGLMGSGISFVAAKSGMDVVVMDVSDEAAEGRAYATQRLDKAIARKRSTEEKKAVLSRLHPPPTRPTSRAAMP